VLAHDKIGGFLGIAMVAFEQKDAAMKAHAAYNGRIVDGRTPIRIDLIVDARSVGAVTIPTRPRTLADRLGPPASTSSADIVMNGTATKRIPTAPRAKNNSLVQRVSQRIVAQPQPRPKVKKPPKRLQRKTQADLDRELDAWLAEAPPKPTPAAHAHG